MLNHVICAVSVSSARSEVPFFRCNAMLIIPSVIMSPTLDEVQQAVNRAVQLVLSVFKAVAKWSKDEPATTTVAEAGTAQNGPQKDNGGGSRSVSPQPATGDQVSQNYDRRGSFASAAPSELMIELGLFVLRC
jgi:hypothetical protein